MSERLGNFTKGIVSANELDFPADALRSGQNVELAQGVRTRGGCSVVSSGSLPAGDVVFLKQVRFPTNETSYLLAQVNIRPEFETRTATIERFGHTAVWDPDNARMLVFGGVYQDDNDVFQTSDELWSYDPVGDAWTELTPVTGPSARYQHTAVWDSTADRMIVFGGADYNSGTRNNETWAFDPATVTWSQLTTTDTPIARRGHKAVYDATGNQMICLGGNYASGSHLPLDSPDVLDLATLTWTNPSWPGGAGFEAYNFNFAVAIDTTTRLIYVWGGQLGEVSYHDTWKVDPTTGTWTQLADYIESAEVDGTYGIAGAFYDGLIYSAFGALPEDTENPTWSLLYDIVTGEWSAPAINGILPSRRYYHTMVVTDTGTIVIFGGASPDNADPAVPSQVLVMSAALWTGGVCSLYASNTELPSTTATFTEIYDLGGGAGTVSAAVLNDRCVITEGVNEPPLVWGGCMTADGSDWMYPKAVLVTQDGQNFYDVSAQVCDKDVDNAADVGGVKSTGYMAICLDMPKVEGLYIEVETPNTGGSGASSTYSSTITFDDDDDFTFEDLKGEIDRWYQDSGTAGHFEGEAKLLAGAAVDLGGGTVKVPCVGHGFVAGDVVRIRNTTNYNALYTLPTQTGGDADNFVITASYNAETFADTDEARKYPTLGTGNDCPLIEAGCRVKFGVTYNHIATITGDGNADSGVTLYTAQATTDVDAITGLETSGDKVQQSLSPAVAGTASFNASLGAGLYPKRCYSGSVRQVIPESLIISSGTQVKVSLKASTGTTVSSVVYPATSFYIRKASIVERDGSTFDGVGAPTPLYFNNGARAATLALGATLESDWATFALDETKDYLVIIDFGDTATEQSYTTTSGWTWGGAEPSVEIGRNVYGAVGLSSSYTQTCLLETNYLGTPPSSADVQACPEGYTQQSALFAVTKIEVHGSSVGVPTNRHVTIGGDAQQVYVGFIDTFVGVEATDTKAGASTLLYAVSFDGRTTWSVWSSSAWRQIARDNSGTWEYNDSASASPNWVAATDNTAFGALRQAFATAQNQMSSATLNGITSAQWIAAGGIVVGATQTVDFAYGFLADGTNLAKLTSLTVTYTDSGNTQVEGLGASGWSRGSGWTDGTEVAGATLGQTGIIDYNGASPFECEYAVVSGVPGYWVRLRMAGTTAGTTITRIMYKAPCQPLANIGDGVPETPMGFLRWDESLEKLTDFTVEVADNVNEDISVADADLAVGDYLYVGGVSRFNAVEIWPFTANTNAATLTGEYWNGAAWTELDITDGTAGDGKPFVSQGKIAFSVPSDWKTHIPWDALISRGYWIRIGTGTALTAVTELSEARLYYIPDALVKHKFVENLGNRIVMGNRPDASDQIDISRELEEYGFSGTNFASMRVGGQDGIHCACSAWNGLLLGKVDSWGMIRESGGQFGLEMIEAARFVPINSRVIVKAPVPGSQDGGRYGLYFINRYGAFVSTGLHTDATWDTGRGTLISGNIDWWEEGSQTPRIDLEYLHGACGEYWPVKNWLVWSVPMIMSGTGQTTNNRLIVFDLTIGAWLPPFTITAASLALGYGYASTVPGKIGAPLLLAGDYSGRVVRILQSGLYTDYGSNISANIETGWLHHGDPTVEKSLQEVYLFGKTAGNVTLTADSILWRREDNVEGAGITKTFSDLVGLTGPVGCAFEGGEQETGNLLKYGLSWSGQGDIYGIQLNIGADRDLPAT